MRADAQTIHLRRSELTVREISDYYERLSNVLRRSYATRLYRNISTEKDPDGAIREVIRHVLDTMR
jgi:hypothetical protein